MRRHAIALFVVTSLAAVAFVPGLGADGTAGVTYHVQSNGPDTVRVTATFTVPNTTLRISLPNDARAVEASNFEAGDGQFDYRLEGPTTATLSYTVSLGDARAEFTGRNVAATSTWALFRRHRVEPDVVATSKEWRVTEQYADDWQGVAGADVAYWGPHERYERQVAGQRVTFVVPAAADIAPRRVLDTLEATATSLRIGARDDRVTVFVAPDPVRRGGLTSGWEVNDTQDIWVHESSSLSTPNDVWVHEYVHTRQDWIADERVAWFREASAEYYGALFAYRQNRISLEAFRAYLGGVTGTANETLDAPESWRTRDVPYEKGALVAAALDARIQTASDGERSLQWVLARMNAHDGTVSADDFQRFAERAAGESLDRWFARYVNGTATPSLPSHPSAYDSPLANQSFGSVLGNQSSVLDAGNQSSTPGAETRFPVPDTENQSSPLRPRTRPLVSG